MVVTLIDVLGKSLDVASNPARRSYDCIACSPRPVGFNILRGLCTGVPARELHAACDECKRREEVCILPTTSSSSGRILMVPSVRTLDQPGRHKARRLMHDLFNASQALPAPATSIWITHFGCVRRYPQPHVLGIFDAIRDIQDNSFGALRLLAFSVDNHLTVPFDCDMRSFLSP